MMDNQPYNWEPEQEQPLPAGKKELFFALGALVCGLLLCNFILYGGWNLGFAIAAGLSILCAAGYLLASGCRPDGYSITLLLLSLVIAAGFARSDDSFVKAVLFLFLTAGAGLGLTLLAGKNRFSPAGFSSLGDVFSSLFGHGFGSSFRAVKGVTVTLSQSGNAAKKGGALLLGLLIAAPVLAVTVPLLIQADAAFDGLMAQLPDFDFKELFSTLLLGSLTGIWLYTLGASLQHSTLSVRPKPLTRSGLNPITVNTVLICLCGVYGVYLFSQIAYFSGGFAGILPEGYSLAAYARRGFFEMALLSGLNLLTVVLLLAWVKKDTRAPLSTRLLCLFLGIVTLFLIASASAKMFFYIESYGLTRLRVLTQLVMLFLAVTTLAVTVWMFLPRLPYMKVVLVFSLLLGALTLWIDVDTQVACYNVDAYLSGQLESVDTYYLSRLNSGAMSHIARLAEQAPDKEVAQAARKALRSRYEAEDFRSWNYADASTAKYGEK